jgi:hypothetical protein
MIFCFIQICMYIVDTLYRKSDLGIPRIETARPHSQFVSNRQTDPGNI